MIPSKDLQRLWIYNKPMGLICSQKDPEGRANIFDVVKEKLQLDHIISVGRLDFNSEGLILLTNDGALSRVLELPVNSLSRTYRVKTYLSQVRVYGILDQEKLARIRRGAVINGVMYGPFNVKIIKRQTRFS
jgi:23S rRNA pseudouridine2605 synthase